MLRLGSPAAGAFAPKAALLHRAAQRGLPVPEGFILPDGEPARAMRDAGPWAVRSAFAAEDGDNNSGAGAFRTELNVEGPAVREAVARVLASAGSEMRRDVLILRMVQAHKAGVAFLERDYLDDLVNWTEGLGDRLVSGATPGESMVLAREGIAHGDALEPWQKRLRRMIARVRRVFGNRNWDIEWADDGARCWLLQVRPITAAPRRNEAFTLANHKEILPDLPSRLMASVIEASAPELFGYYRGFDDTLPEKRLFIELFAGRPLINISLMSDLMRHWGLPTSLVTSNIGGETDHPAGLNPPRLLRKLPVLVRMAWAQLRAPAEARRLLRAVEDSVQQGEGDFSETLGQLRASYVALVRGMFGLTAAMSGPLAMLRAAGVLEAWSARLRTPGSEMYAALAELPLLDGAEREAGWARWIQEYGHRGVYESDVARPRFREDPTPVLAALGSSEPRRRESPRLSALALLLWPLWLQASRPMRAREEFRSGMMRQFERIRARLLRLCVERGIEAEALWMLSAEEARRLDAGWRPDGTFLREREAEIRGMAAIRLPDLVRRFDDLSARGAGEGASSRIRGISLTSGVVEGRAWTPREPGETPPEGFDPAETILVARSVDAGWVPCFLRVAGVAVQTGGDLSHGSIILREIGLPAITNAGPALDSIQQGSRVRLNAGLGLIETLSGEPARHSLIESEAQSAVF